MTTRPIYWPLKDRPENREAGPLTKKAGNFTEGLGLAQTSNRKTKASRWSCILTRSLSHNYMVLKIGLKYVSKSILGYGFTK